MPIYVYKCDSCDDTFEVWQSFDDDALVLCTRCNETSLHRVIFSSPVHYKGSGFNTTDARGITGRKRKPKIKVGTVADLPPEEREKHGY